MQKALRKSPEFIYGQSGTGLLNPLKIMKWNRMYVCIFILKKIKIKSVERLNF